MTANPMMFKNSSQMLNHKTFDKLKVYEDPYNSFQQFLQVSQMEDRSVGIINSNSKS